MAPIFSNFKSYKAMQASSKISSSLTMAHDANTNVDLDSGDRERNAATNTP